MEFQQLYYTSCEAGLSDYAGYQFNAVTPGVGPEVMGEVEALSSYEPPRSLGHDPTGEQIRACPVNLCFVPGGMPILANVVFAGTDYSGRFGNYFAHAIVPADPTGQPWAGLLPIELWGAPFWAREEAGRRELPALRGPLTPGPLNRCSVDAFLDSSGGRRHLPALLVAAERAVLDEQRSVVIVAPAGDQIAYWIAAASFLLPPSLVARMSFATYQFRPGYSRQHVIGTVPDAEIDTGDRAFESFYLFDFTAGRASPVPAEPLAELLAGLGAEAAEALWRRSTELAAGTEIRLADWHPVVTAAALLEGAGVSEADLDALQGWLAGNAARLGAPVAGRIGAAMIAHEAAGPAHLAGVAEAAAAAGLAELLGEAETRLVAAAFRGESAVTTMLRSASAREYAERQYTARLVVTDGSAVAGLLNRAETHGVRPEGRVLRECGLRVVGPLVLDGALGTGLRETLGRWPELRAGVLEHLDSASAGGSRRLLGAFANGLDEVIPEDELAAWPALAEVLAIARARREPQRRVGTLMSVLKARGPRAELDPALLSTLWPDRWSLEDAVAVLPGLPVGPDRSPVLADWLVPLLSTPLPMDDLHLLDCYAALCDTLYGSPISRALPPDAIGRLRTMAWIRQAEAAYHRARKDKERHGAVHELVSGYEKRAAGAREYLLARLAQLLPWLAPEHLATILPDADEKVRHAYLTGVQLALQNGGEDAVIAAADAFVTSRCALRNRRRSFPAAIEGLLLGHLPHWRNKDLNAVDRLVRRRSGRMSEEFKHWRERHCRRGWSRTFGRLLRG